MAPPTLTTANCCDETDLNWERYCSISLLELTLPSKLRNAERVEAVSRLSEVEAYDRLRVDMRAAERHRGPPAREVTLREDRAANRAPDRTTPCILLAGGALRGLKHSWR